MDVNEELKFLGKFTIKFGGGGQVGGGRVGGGGCERNVGVGVMWGMGDVNQE